jgi:hypothetical protein
MSNFITLTEAQDMTTRYRNSVDDMLTSSYQGALLNCETFDASAVQDLLDQSGCEKFRVYFGMDENNKVRAIMVGVGADNEDILNGSSSLIVEKGTTCPDICQTNLL